MAPHGTSNRYKSGCRCTPCRRDHTREKKAWLLGLRGQLVPALGTHRRIRALVALGWTYGEIAAACGVTTREWTGDVLRSERVHIDTHERVADAYRAMSMTVPEGPLRNRQRLFAARKGWLPPLAYDDPDTDPEPPGEPASSSPGSYDPAVVERILGGDWRMGATTAERREVLRRWLATGRPGNELGRLTGWRWDRYREGAA